MIICINVAVFALAEISDACFLFPGNGQVGVCCFQQTHARINYSYCN